EDAARDAVAIARGKRAGGTSAPTALLTAARSRARRFTKSQQLLHGLYSGGTLAQEAAIILTQLGVKHTVVDLGDDEFTGAPPLPMTAFRLRTEPPAAGARDPPTAVILLDVVLGYGAHADPAAALAPAITAARKAAGRRAVVLVASVCGTATD